MPIERVDHVAESQRQLLSQYFTRDTPKLRAVLKSFTDEIQALHEDVIYLERMLFLDEAEGVFLDIAGELVVEQRNGRSDEVYREAIRVKAAVNRFSGTVDDLLTLIRLSYSEPSGAKYTHAGGPTADIVIDAPFASLRPSLERLQQNLNRAKPAGREVYVHFKLQNPGFRFDTVGQGLDQGKMFGTISDGKIVGSDPEISPFGLTVWGGQFAMIYSTEAQLEFQANGVGELRSILSLASDPVPEGSVIQTTGTAKAIPIADNPDMESYTGLSPSTAYRADAVFVDVEGRRSALVYSFEFVTTA